MVGSVVFGLPLLLMAKRSNRKPAKISGLMDFLRCFFLSILQSSVIKPISMATFAFGVLPYASRKTSCHCK